jgi:hypothetical protein
MAVAVVYGGCPVAACVMRDVANEFATVWPSGFERASPQKNMLSRTVVSLFVLRCCLTVENNRHDVSSSSYLFLVPLQLVHSFFSIVRQLSSRSISVLPALFSKVIIQ